MMLTACGGSHAGGGSSSAGASNLSGTVSGAAAKGLLLNAPVSFYAVTNDVAGTTAVGSTTTDATTGAFSSTITSNGPVVVTVTVNGSTQMLDELSGAAIAAPSGLVLHAVFDSLTNLQPIAVTPLTEMAYQTAVTSSGGLTTTNIDAANNAVSTLFLGGAPALYTQPIAISDYASATVAQQALAKLLTAMDIAANTGLAVNASGSPCGGTYAQELVCMVAGLPSLLTISSSGVSPTANAGYLTVAYTDLDDDASLTVDGGQSPAQLGLDATTAAETSFLSAFSQQGLPLPGFVSAGDPLTNTKDLIANIRTNIVDQGSTQTFGYAPTLTALNKDMEQNVSPTVAGTSSLISAAYLGAELIQYGQGTNGYGTATSRLASPLEAAADGNGNLFLINGNDTVLEVNSSGAVSLLAGEANVTGEVNTSAASSTFEDAVAIAADSSDNVYVGDLGAVRLISNGEVSTLAGGGVSQLGTNNGNGTGAQFLLPTAMTTDSAGNVYVLDTGAPSGTAIREVTSAGDVSTLVRSTLLNGGEGLARDASGNFYVANFTADIVQEVTSGGVISTFAGEGVAGDTDATGTAAAFNGPVGLTIDGSGNLYVGDTGNTAVREITPAGVVTTVAQTTSGGGVLNPNKLGGIGLALSGGNLYVTNYRLNTLQEISSGAVNTVVHGTANYQGGCGYDPAGLETDSNTALCRYGHGQNVALLTLTQTGAGVYTVQTQPLVYSASNCSGNETVIPCGLAPAASIAPLSAQFTLTSTGGAQSAGFSGPYYVTVAGGQVTASLTAAEAAGWNDTTGTGTITLAGGLSGGSGGVSLQSATIGSDTALTVANVFSGTLSLKTLIAAKAPPVTVTGTVDLQQLTTDAFSYAAKVSLGTPVYDVSGQIAVPQSVDVTGSVSQGGSSNATPLFNGTVSVNITGFSAYNVTQPLSATNSFSTQAQVSGTLDLSDSRVLTVTATASASQLTPTQAAPDSASVTYSYATPSGTAQLNASGQYDTTNGFSGTISNNAGVVIAVTYPVHGALTGTITAGGTATATIKGAFVYYSDNTSESLF
ncbi:MAG: hypothetical protein ACREU2_10135 [Steroidobacteraceae bacterium]